MKHILLLLITIILFTLGAYITLGQEGIEDIIYSPPTANTATIAASPSASGLPDRSKVAKELYISNIQLLNNYGGIISTYVDTNTQPGGGKYFCGALPRAQAQHASATVLGALARLPAQSLARIDLRYLLLCSEAKANSRSIGGIPVPPLKLLMLSTGTSGSNKLAYNTLHELYHLIEFQDNSFKDGSWDRRFSGYNNRYPNNSSTTIGSGGTGFVNGYSKSFPHEERAELFTLLHFSPQALTRYATQKNDTLLQEKISFMQQKCKRMLGEGGC